MSSPKGAAAATAGRGRVAARSTSKSQRDTVEGGSLSADATRLAAQVERALLQGRTDVLTPDALQALMAAACKVYTARVEVGDDILPLKQRTNVSATEVMTTASGLLRAVNLAVFELGMWQSWTGR
jgi:hypothetical protein